MGIAHLRHGYYDEGNDDEDVQIVGEMMIFKGGDAIRIKERIKNDDIYMGSRSPHLTWTAFEEKVLTVHPLNISRLL